MKEIKAILNEIKGMEQVSAAEFYDFIVSLNNRLKLNRSPS